MIILLSEHIICMVTLIPRCRDDLDGAYDALVAVSGEHNVMPMKGSVMRQLIKKEDTER